MVLSLETMAFASAGLWFPEIWVEVTTMVPFRTTGNTTSAHSFFFVALVLLPYYLQIVMTHLHSQMVLFR